MNMRLQPLFAVPLGVDKIERELTSQEMATILSLEHDTYQNSGSRTTNSVNVLDRPEFAELKTELEAKVQDYFEQVFDPATEVSCYITLSWLNYTKENGYHHKHSHPNSFISGVFYPKINSGVDKINFYQTGHQHVDIVPKAFNEYNARVWSIILQNNDLLLFPSSLEHGVELVKHPEPRISLAFNAWLRGEVGNDHRITTMRF
jgi:uncharacterized protein (TIGR02466 family)